MYKNQIQITAEHGSMADKLKEIGLFERIIDVFLSGAMVGVLYKRKGCKKSGKSVSIFTETINLEMIRIKYIASLAYLIENHHMKGDEIKERELLRQAFGDWFKEPEEDEDKKYKLLEEYALGGIEILYNKIIGYNTDKDAYYQNYYRFIEEISSFEVNDYTEMLIQSKLL